MVRPFRYGDIFLIQRLGRQATKLNIVQATLHRQSALGASLGSVFPWNHGKLTTYVLSQRGNRLARAGFLQTRLRPGRSELDVTYLAPSLDNRRGHPAIWEKLLSFLSSEAARRHIERIYAQVPDQPLLVNTFTHAGFRTYDRQTTWRLIPGGLETTASAPASDIRQHSGADSFALEELYRRVVPETVQMAEGLGSGQAVRMPILSWWYGGSSCSYVSTDQGEVRGSIQIARGSGGIWLQPWYDYLDPQPDVAYDMLLFALGAIRRWTERLPVYVAVRQYHGALASILSEFAFAPVSDRALMMKHVHQRVRESVAEHAMSMESTPSVATVPFDLATTEKMQALRQPARLKIQ